MTKFFKNFCKSEAGAVTVDWVVLTAAVVGIAVIGYSAIETGVVNLTKQTGDALAGELTTTATQ